MRFNLRNLLPPCLALALCAVAVAQEAAAPEKKIAPPGPLAQRPVRLPEITGKKLANGLTVVLAPMPNIPKVTLVLSIHSGISTDRKLHPGIAGLVSDTLTEGTATRSSKQIKEELRSIGGTIRVDASNDATDITANALSEFTPRLFDLVADVVRNPSFPEKEVALAKDNTVQSIRARRSNPDFLANERFQKAVFGDHPYSFVVPGEKSVMAMTPAMLKQYETKYFVPNNAHIVVVGDFEPEAMLAQIEKSLGPWKSAPLAAEPEPALPRRDKRQIYFVDRPDSIQSVILIGLAVIPRKDPDYFVLRTANVILGGSFYSRITKNIREEKGYTYSPFSTAFTMGKPVYFQAAAPVRNEVTGPTLLEIFYEMDRMRWLPVSDEELNAAKAFSVGNFAIELASQGSLAGRINTIYSLGLARTFISDFGPRIQALTPAEIQRASEKYFDTYRSAVVIVGDYSKVKDQVAPFGEVSVFDSGGNPVKP